MALRDLFASVRTGERREQHADTVALEFELKVSFDPLPPSRGSTVTSAQRADRAVDASKRALVWGVVLGDLIADLAGAAGQSAFVCGAAAEPGRSFGVDLDAHDLLLPLAVLGQVLVVREDVYMLAPACGERQRKPGPP